MEPDDPAVVARRAEPFVWPLYALFVVSGLTALVYEVMWMRGFSLVFGSTTRASSVVLATFFFGMALGNWIGGRVSDRRRAALRLYGVLEIAVAAGAVVVLGWLAVYRASYPALYQSPLGSAAGLTLIQVLLALLAMAPPCIAMGMTLPLVSRAVVTRVGHLGQRVGLIYAFNTLGATGGALLAGFALPVLFGVRNTVILAAVTNAGVGILALWLWSRWPDDRSSEPAAAPPPSTAHDTDGSTGSRSSFRLVAAVAAASGFGTLALEVLYSRLIVNAIDCSVHSFAVMLAIFLVCLALGAALVSLMVDRLPRPWALVASTALLASLAILVSPTVFEWAFSASPRPRGVSQAAHLAWLLRFAALVLAPPAILVGMILPATWKIATRTHHDTGRRVGRLTAVNTLAAAAGSVGAGFALIPLLGVGGGLAVVSALYLAVGVIAAARAFGAKRAVVTCGFALAGFALLASFAPWRVVPVRLRPGERLVSYHEGDTGSVALISLENGLSLRLNNDYTLGTSRPTGIRVHRSQGQLALLLHGEPRDVAFIGVATGLSLSSIGDLPSVRRAVALEIVPGVVQAAHAFHNANRNVLADPRVEIIVADGRNHLFGTAERFDVVVGDLFTPWRAGTGYLYTAEHFANVRARLNPGGVFVQWLQLRQLSRHEFQVITGTFSDAFEDAELWQNEMQPTRPLLALVGRTSPRPPAPPPAALAGSRFVCGAETLRRWTAGAPRNTDDHPIIEFSTASSHLTRQGADVRALTEQLDRLRAFDDAL